MFSFDDIFIPVNVTTEENTLFKILKIVWTTFCGLCLIAAIHTFCIPNNLYGFNVFVIFAFSMFTITASLFGNGILLALLIKYKTGK